MSKRIKIKWLSVIVPAEGFVPAEGSNVVPKSQLTIRPDHPKVTAELANKLLGYLERGQLVVHTTGLTEDVLDPERDKIVGMSIYTDGKYAWSDGLVYYLRRYLLSPGEEFVAYCESKGFEVGKVDKSAVMSVVADIFEESEQ